jgi:hypothetical protein
MASVERLQAAVRLLMAERENLRARAAGGDELEATRLELVSRQQELAHAVVARCLLRSDRDAT